MEFTILHRGVPLGTAATRRRGQEDDDGDAPGAGREGEPPDPFAFSFLDFRPLPAYAAVAPVLQLAAQAFRNYGFLGPAADPASDAAGKAARAAAEALWAEFELADASTGAPVAGRVEWFLDYAGGGEPYYWLTVKIDGAGAAVPARLPHPRRSGRAHEPPAA